ncbi:MAG TPA: FAD-dependent oxidoreductase [Solirubrobacteraceae bacterium]|nr:FAD-dependent oxidoreductase [Solirubrobacteraceae bacterium]
MSRDARHELLVVGGGPAALAALRAFRAAGGEGRASLITDEHRMPYMRPAVSKALLRGELSEQDVALHEDRELGEMGIELISGRAVGLDPAAHTVMLSGGRECSYRRCLLATGAEPVRLPVDGVEDPAVRTLRSIDDLRELRARLSAGMPVVIIGSGFIGCEIAASLRSLGHPVTVCSQESAPNVARIGDQAAAAIAGWLQETGTELRLGAEVRSVSRSGGQLAVHTDAGTAVGGLVVMAAGVSPRAELAALAGLALEQRAIPTDERMRTGLPDVLAAGDVARAQNATAGRRLRIEHWGDALAQGQVAGQTAAGEGARWTSVPGFWTQIGDHTLKYAGWGDGFDEIRLDADAAGFTAWYRGGDRITGVLTHGHDDDYEQGRELVAAGAPWR